MSGSVQFITFYSNSKFVNSKNTDNLTSLKTENSENEDRDKNREIKI